MNIVQSLSETAAVDDAVRTIQEENKESMAQLRNNHNGKENGAELKTLLIKRDHDGVNDHSTQRSGDKRSCRGDGNGGGCVHDNHTECVHKQRNTECYIGRIL